MELIMKKTKILFLSVFILSSVCFGKEDTTDQKGKAQNDKITNFIIGAKIKEINSELEGREEGGCTVSYEQIQISLRSVINAKNQNELDYLEEKEVFSKLLILADGFAHNLVDDYTSCRCFKTEDNKTSIVCFCDTTMEFKEFLKKQNTN